MNKIIGLLSVFLGVSIFVSAPECRGQTRLSLQEAVNKAVESRPALKAASEAVAVAQGARRQVGAIANPTFNFENQNLRPGQTYSRDVDTYAYLSQPLDILGKRKRRIEVAAKGVESSQTEYEAARREVALKVKASYWAARGAQEVQTILQTTVNIFQEIVDYHAAQLSVGAIPEQDFLRVRLESERLKIEADLAALNANRSRVNLQRAMGLTDFGEMVLTEALDANTTERAEAGMQQVLAQRIEMRTGRAAVEQAQAKLKLENVATRPDLGILFGYKRTQLASSTTGVNTMLAGANVTLPITDRNQGNRAAAEAELRRQQQLLAETEAGVRADYFAAQQEYRLRRSEVSQTLQPLQEHAANILEIARAAYQQGGTDLLRLLDAQRAQLDAQLAYVRGMAEYQQSVVNLEAAEGVAP